MIRTLDLDSPIPEYRTPAVSEESRSIMDQLRDAIDSSLSTIFLGKIKMSLFSEVSEIEEECSINNWDGAGSEPISPIAITMAELLIYSFPQGIPLPELTPATDGEIHFDWRVGHKQALTASLSNNGFLSFAFIKGGRRFHGSEPFEGTFPERLSDLLNELYALKRVA
ncbi:MAG: hypothetical protein O7C75_21535 [Verrucomicrobia bacterium]|nr:hypothetical protein [Verrucomicrobiota bacterium]